MFDHLALARSNFFLFHRWELCPYINFLISFKPVPEVKFKLELRNVLESRNEVIDHFCHAQVAQVDSISVKQLVSGLPAPNFIPWEVNHFENLLCCVLTLSKVTLNTLDPFTNPESGRLKQVHICIL